MTPLRITARLAGEIRSSLGTVYLDALLASVVARERGLVPPVHEDELVPIEIPLEREPGGRFHLASAGLMAFELRRIHWRNRRFPIEMAQAVGRGMKRINLAAGAQKHFRIPMEVGHLVDDQVVWWARGDAGEVRRLLRLVSRIGGRRGVGFGAIREGGWQVEELADSDLWTGFPVLAPDGRPLRVLPLDWPGLVSDEAREERLTYPYWWPWGRELAAVPEAA